MATGSGVSNRIDKIVLLLSAEREKIERVSVRDLARCLVMLAVERHPSVPELEQLIGVSPGTLLRVHEGLADRAREESNAMLKAQRDALPKMAKPSSVPSVPRNDQRLQAPHDQAEWLTSAERWKTAAACHPVEGGSMSNVVTRLIEDQEIVERHLVGSKGYWITLVEVANDGREKWAIWSPSAEVLGLRWSRATAEKAVLELEATGRMTA
jgi:hypothetical protein